MNRTLSQNLATWLNIFLVVTLLGSLLPAAATRVSASNSENEPTAGNFHGIDYSNLLMSNKPDSRLIEEGLQTLSAGARPVSSEADANSMAPGLTGSTSDYSESPTHYPIDPSPFNLTLAENSAPKPIKSSIPMSSNWSSSTQISSGVEEAATPVVAVQSNKAYAVWISGTVNIVLARSSDSGQTWDGNIRHVTNFNGIDEGSASKPAITVDSNGTIYVAFYFVPGEGSPFPSFNGIHVIKSTDEGQSWSGAIYVDDDLPSNWLIIDVDDYDNLYVAWDQQGGHEVYFSFSQDGGQSWSQTPILAASPPGGEGCMPASDIVASGNKIVHVVFNEWCYEMTFVEWSHDGTNWTQSNTSSFPLQLYSQTAKPSPTITEIGSNVYVAWNHYYTSGTYGIHFSASNDGGNTWNSYTQAYDSIDQISAPKIAIRGSGQLVISWMYNQVVYVTESIDNGSTWSAEIPVGYCDNNTEFDLAGDPASGAVVLVWEGADSNQIMATGSSSPAANLEVSPYMTLAPNECPMCSPGNLQNNDIQGPINSFSGNYNYQTTDLSLSTVGQPLRFERTYNSLPVSGTVVYSRPLGYGWTHNYDINLTLPDDPGGEENTIILKAPHGSRLRFTDEDTDGIYEPYPGVWADIERRGSAAPYTYVITAANQTVYTFGLLADTVAVEPLWATTPLSLTLRPDYHVAAAPGTVLTLTHILTNSGTTTDTYDLTAQSSGNWVTVDPPTATLASGAAITVTAFVAAPVSYGREAVITATIQATSRTTPTLTATAQETLTLRGYRLLTSVDPQGNVTEFEYDSEGYLGTATDQESGRYLSFDYDTLGRLASVSDSMTPVRSIGFSYDALDNLTVYTDTRGLAWTYTYTAPVAGIDPHLLHEVREPAPGQRVVERTFFDEEGRAVRQENGLGQAVAEIGYDTLGSNQIRRIIENGKVYTDTYNSQNLLIGQEVAGAGAQSYQFDSSFNRSQVTDGEGNVTRYARDEMGLTWAITQTIDGRDIPTSFSYDGNNNLESVTDARGNTTSYEYDAGNNLKKVVNPPSVGGTTVYTYNTRGQVTEVEDERGNVTHYTYDPNTGNRTSVTDAMGSTTTYEYDPLGRVITTTQPSPETGQPTGKVTVNQYDPAGNLVQVTENFLAGQPQNYQNEYNLVTQYEYDEGGRRTVITDTRSTLPAVAGQAVGRVTRSFYDAAGRLERTVENYRTDRPADNEYNLATEYGYDTYGRQTTVTDPAGKVTRTFYDSLAGRVERTVANYVDGVYDSNEPDEDIVTRYEYDANGNVTRTILLPGSAEEQVTCTYYDELNRVEKTVENCQDGDHSGDNPDVDLVTSYTYDDVGNQETVTDPKGRTTGYDYDALNRVITITHPLPGAQTSYGYDPAGNRIRVTDAEQHSTYYEYDALNRLVTTTNQLSGQTIVSYDHIGNRTGLTDARDHTTTYHFDSLNRLIEVTDAETQTTRFTYNALGNKLTQTDAELRVTRYDYDSLNRLTATTLNYVEGGPVDHQTNVTTINVYDVLSRRTQVLDPRSNPTGYGYDRLGRTLAITDALGHATTYVYDGLGNRRSVTNAEGETTYFAYDGVNRLVSVEDNLGHTTTYQYDEAGNRTLATDAETVQTFYDYDSLDRLTVVIENYDPGGPTDNQTNVATGYGYDLVGNRTVVTSARGFPTTYDYDELNRQVRVTDPLNNITEYGYDPVGNRTVITDANTLAGLGGAVTNFVYDNVNRLTKIDYSNTLLDPDVQFFYDNVGNRETMTDSTGTTSYSYDDLYRLTGVTSPQFTVSYSYDAAGNRTGLTYPNSFGSVTYQYDDANRLDLVTASWLPGQFDYNYDNANRLTGLELPNGVASTYDYDDAGRLSLLAHSTITETLAGYAYDLDNVGNRRTLTETLITVQELPAGAYLEQDGLVVLEAENFSDRTNSLTHQWNLKTSQPGYTGTSYIQPLPDLDILYQTHEITASPHVEFPIHFTTPETYTLWLRGYPTNAAGDSAYVSLGEQVVDVTGFGPGQWEWANLTTDGVTATLPVSTTGLLTLTLSMREDGLRVDRLLLVTDTTPTVPSAEGPAETDRQLTAGGLIVPLSRTIVYTYDHLYRLTDADYSSGEVYTYTYDPAGNREQQTVAGEGATTYQYDDANRLTQVSGPAGSLTYVFDKNGNLTQTGQMTNTWDAANRLATTTRDDYTLEPIYNGVGDRIGQTAGVTTTHFALDVQGLPEVIYTSPSTGSGQPGEAFLHLPGIIVVRSEEGEVQYLLSDGLGSVRQATDEAGAVVASYEFDPYGNPVDNNGGDPYGYTGEWWESYANLLYLRARWYLAETGTFLSYDQWLGDPLRPQSFNPYGYVGGNPINLADASGQCYPPIDSLRSIEGVVCSNLDQAIYIYAHPYSSNWERAGASLYISTWAVSHAAFLVGGTISGGAGAQQGISAIAAWGYAYLLAHPTLAKAIGIGAIAYSTADDAATIYGAVSGDPQAIQDAMLVQQMAASDGSAPFFDGVAGGWFFGKRGLYELSSCSALPGFTPEETRYIRDALNNDIRNLRNSVVCFDSARCLETFTPIGDDLYYAREVGQFVSKLDGSTFRFVGELGNTVQLHELAPGDFLLYYWHGEPVHANRFLGISEDVPLFFEKWDTGPFEVKTFIGVKAKVPSGLDPILVFRR